MAVDTTDIGTILTEARESTDNPVAATGTITFSGLPTAAARASGVITFSGQPTADTDSVTLNGTQVVFKASGATGNEVDIGGDQAATVVALHAFLAASADAEIAKFTWTTNSTSTVTGTAKVWGTAGNSLTLAKSGTNLAVSGGTLTGGSAGDSVTVNGVALQFIPASQTSPTATDVAIGASAAATGTLLKTYLNASVNGSIDDATYTDNGAGVVTVTHDTGGTAGNSFTLAKSGSNIAVSGATLSGGAAEGPEGQLNVSGTDTGAILAARTDDSFEQYVLALMAAWEFVVANAANPTTSSATATQSRQQRKLIRRVMMAMAEALPVVADSSADDRTTVATAVRTAGIKAFGRFNRVAGL